VSSYGQCGVGTEPQNVQTLPAQVVLSARTVLTRTVLGAADKRVRDISVGVFELMRRSYFIYINHRAFYN
jgi:hypothetical protein